MKLVDYNGTSFVCRFSGDSFTESLNFVKAIPGSSFDPKNRIWTVPSNAYSSEILEYNGWEFTKEASQICCKKPDVVVDESALVGLRPFQIEGVKFVENHDGHAIIGDECGLGKTIQAIGVMKLHPDKVFVVVCTASMKLKWAREIKKWTGKDAHIIYGEKDSKLPKAPYYIINYHILGREDASARKIENKKKEECKNNGTRYKATKVPVLGWWKRLADIHPYGIFADESHRLSDDKAIWTRSFVELVREVDPKILVPLSGTPIRKRPALFFTILNLVNKDLFPNKYKYLYRYCDPYHNGFGWEFLGASNVRELRDLLLHVMIRRLKEEVATELPPRELISVPLELDTFDEKNYKNANEQFIDFLHSSVVNKVVIKKHLAALKQLAYIAKRNSVFKWIDEFLEDNDKLVIFGWHKIAITDLVDRYSEICVKVDGSVSAKDRQLAEDRFQNDSSIKLFIGQIDAGGEGLTLTSSNTVAFVEFPDTPGQLFQAADRVHRIGQVADTVYIYCLFADGTIENHIVEGLEDSYTYLKAILDGVTVSGIFTQDFDDIIVRRMTM